MDIWIYNGHYWYHHQNNIDKGDNMKYLLLGYGRSNMEVKKILDKLEIEYKIFHGFKDDIEEKCLDDVDIIVRSPGISLSHPLLMLANLKGIGIISEIDFAYSFNNKGIIIGCTGSNGKTSTLYYLYQILKNKYDDVILVGNNGIPYSSMIDKIKDETIVLLELSSFQLENTSKLKLDYAVVTNISENHLDNVANYDEYIKSKIKIFSLLKEKGKGLINLDDTILKHINLANPIYFSFDKKNSINIKNELKDFESKRIIGLHNKYNILISYILAIELGLEKENIINYLDNVKGVKYRLEYLKDINNVSIYNDGKSSTPNSVLAALNSFQNKKIHLILGGRDKNLDFSILKEVKNVEFYAYGEIKETLKKVLNAKIYDTFKSAYNAINAKENEVILFSPGCTSFDQFKDYEERSLEFERMINIE